MREEGKKSTGDKYIGGQVTGVLQERKTVKDYGEGLSRCYRCSLEGKKTGSEGKGRIYEEGDEVREGESGRWEERGVEDARSDTGVRRVKEEK